MPESSSFRIPLQNTGVHGSLTTTNPGMQHFYPNFQLILQELSYKISPLVRLEILGPFGKTFTGNHMNSSHNRDKFPRQGLMPLSPKSNKCSALSSSCIKSTQNFQYFEKKSTSYLKYLGSYRIQQMWLLECQKTPVSEHPLANNKQDAAHLFRS